MAAPVWAGWWRDAAREPYRCERGHKECNRCGGCACPDSPTMEGRVTTDSGGGTLCRECRREGTVGNPY